MSAADFLSILRNLRHHASNGVRAPHKPLRLLFALARLKAGQDSSRLPAIQVEEDRIEAVLSCARQNLTSQLSVGELAGAAALSPRQFSRAFRTETGQSPAKAVEQTRHPVEIIARKSGFADPERMWRAFLRAFRQPPQAMRRAARPAA